MKISFCILTGSGHKFSELRRLCKRARLINVIRFLKNRVELRHGLIWLTTRFRDGLF
jgi:hypothetical protein